MTRVTATTESWSDLAGSIEWSDVTAAIVRRIRAQAGGQPSHVELSLTLNEEEFALLEEPIVDMGWENEFTIGSPAG